MFGNIDEFDVLLHVVWVKLNPSQHMSTKSTKSTNYMHVYLENIVQNIIIVCFFPCYKVVKGTYDYGQNWDEASVVGLVHRNRAKKTHLGL